LSWQTWSLEKCGGLHIS